MSDYYHILGIDACTAFLPVGRAEFATYRNLGIDRTVAHLIITGYMRGQVGTFGKKYSSRS